MSFVQIIRNKIANFYARIVTKLSDRMITLHEKFQDRSGAALLERRPCCLVLACMRHGCRIQAYGPIHGVSRTRWQSDSRSKRAAPGPIK